MMKKFQHSLLLLCSVFVLSCSHDPRKDVPQTGTYGATVAADSAITVQAVLAGLDTTDSFHATVTGTITELCKGEGCWMMLQGDDQQTLLIEIRDKAFVLPYGVESKKAFATGTAVKHAEDTTFSLVADGVRID